MGRGGRDIRGRKKGKYDSGIGRKEREEESESGIGRKLEKGKRTKEFRKGRGIRGNEERRGNRRKGQ